MRRPQPGLLGVRVNPVGREVFEPRPNQLKASPKSFLCVEVDERTPLYEAALDHVQPDCFEIFNDLPGAIHQVGDMVQTFSARSKKLRVNTLPHSGSITSH